MPPPVGKGSAQVGNHPPVWLFADGILHGSLVEECINLFDLHFNKRSRSLGNIVCPLVLRYYCHEQFFLIFYPIVVNLSP